MMPRLSMRSQHFGRMPQTVNVPTKLLDAQGKQRVNFQLTGRGQFTYQCVLSGFVPADQLKSTTQTWQVRRFHEPARGGRRRRAPEAPEAGSARCRQPTWHQPWKRYAAPREPTPFWAR